MPNFKYSPSFYTVWIFQVNPKRYDIVEALQNNKVISEIHWAVNQYKKSIEKDHTGILWQSGEKAGVLAITKILTDPGYFNETDQEKSYWISGYEEADQILRVKMEVQCNLWHAPLYRETIKTTPVLQNMSILKQPRGTNFPVKEDEWRILEGLIRNRM